jgi:hypothetical protein
VKLPQRQLAISNFPNSTNALSLMGRKELNLDGGEIAIIKAIGLSGSEMRGDDLMARVPDQSAAELIDTLKGLISVGYINSDKSGFYDNEDMKTVHFQVNSGYAKELRDAMDPNPERPKSRRMRRE